MRKILFPLSVIIDTPLEMLPENNCAEVCAAGTHCHLHPTPGLGVSGLFCGVLALFGDAEGLQ